MKTVALTFAGLVSIPFAASAHQIDERSPVVYNSMENEVAVIKGITGPGGRGHVVIQPTHKFFGLGYYTVVMPRETLRPRQRGGWYTSIRTISCLTYGPSFLPTSNPAEISNLKDFLG